jgi:hypothetical protein
MPSSGPETSGKFGAFTRQAGDVLSYGNLAGALHTSQGMIMFRGKPRDADSAGLSLVSTVECLDTLRRSGQRWIARREKDEWR